MLLFFRDGAFLEVVRRYKEEAFDLLAPALFKIKILTRRKKANGGKMESIAKDLAPIEKEYLRALAFAKDRLNKMDTAKF